jgi:hypothetical protein
VTFEDGCQSTSNSINVDLCQGLTAPELVVNGNTFSVADEWDNYQWYQDGNLIDGANSAAYTASENGTYYVVVSTNENCEYQSDSYLYESGGNPAGVTENELLKISVYPNPVHEILNINLGGIPAPDDLFIFNSLGQVVFHQNFDTWIDLSSLQSGVYYVKVGEYSLRIIRD